MSESPALYGMQTASLADALCSICRLFGERQWCLATSGNFSARLDANHFLITQSGKDKSSLTPDDLMSCDLDGRQNEPHLRPSAETALHRQLYRYDENVRAVLHTHSVISTVLSQRAGASVSFSGFEMQKAFSGVTSHESEIAVPVFENSQDMAALAKQVRAWLEENAWTAPAFLIRGHGLYAWGRDLQEAKRHTEGMEFLMSCAWQQMLADAQ